MSFALFFVTQVRQTYFALGKLCCALGIGVYFCMPFPLPLLGTSLHVLPVVLGGVSVLPQCVSRMFSRYGLRYFFLFIAVVGVSMLSAPSSPVMVELRTWLVSLLAFCLCLTHYQSLNRNGINLVVKVLLLLISVAAIGQAFIGEAAYVSNWFGAPVVTVYAVGLTIYSNQAAIMLVPLLILVISANLDRASLHKYMLWMAGCIALYLTLSRAGWLALLVGLLVLVIHYRNEFIVIRRLCIHFAVGLMAVALIWIAPTRIDCYEPGGDCSAGRWSRVSDYSAATRLATLRVALRAVAEYPVSGLGLGHFPEYYSRSFDIHDLVDVAGSPRVDPRSNLTPHNGYAQVAAELGLPALVAFLLFLHYLLARLIQCRSPEAVALLASLVGMVVWLLFHDGLNHRLLWILLGCTASLVQNLPKAVGDKG